MSFIDSFSLGDFGSGGGISTQGDNSDLFGPLPTPVDSSGGPSSVPTPEQQQANQEASFLASFGNQPSTTLNTSNPFNSFFSSLTGPTVGYGLQPGNSPTPNTGAGQGLFSNILAGIGGVLNQAIPQFTTALAKGGLTSLEQSTFNGLKTGPTTAAPGTLQSALGNLGPYLLLGGGAILLYFLLKE